MSDQVTVQYGPWSPDLHDVATELPGTPSTVKVACADVLNVYFQDGAFRCLPSPQSFGPSVGTQVLTAFTWYDEVNGQEIVFTGNAQGITALMSAIIGGPLLPTPIGVENAIAVSVNSLSLTTSLHGTITVSPLKSRLALGAINVTGASNFIYQGSMVSASTGNFAQGNAVYGYELGSQGSINPVSDLRGHQILTIVWQQANKSITLQFTAPNLGQNYFSRLSIAGGALLSSNAIYGGVGNSTWIWQNAANFGPGTFSVTIAA